MSVILQPQSEIATGECEKRIESARSNIAQTHQILTAKPDRALACNTTIAGQYLELAIYSLVLGRRDECISFFKQLSITEMQLDSLRRDAANPEHTTNFMTYVLALRYAVIANDRDRSIRLAALKTRPCPDEPYPQTPPHSISWAHVLGSLILLDDNRTLIHVEELLKDSNYDLATMAAQAILSKDIETFKVSLTKMLDRWHKDAANPRDSIHGLPASFLCWNAMVLAIIAIWRGVVKREDVPQRQAMLKLKTHKWQSIHEKQVPFELKVDYLPQCLLPERPLSQPV